MTGFRESGPLPHESTEQSDPAAARRRLAGACRPVRAAVAGGRGTRGGTRARVRGRGDHARTHATARLMQRLRSIVSARSRAPAGIQNATPRLECGCWKHRTAQLHCQLIRE